MELRLDDWEVEYAGNRFAWLGNGFSQTELDESADWAFYIREKDDDEPLARIERLRRINGSGTVAPGGNEGVNFTGKGGGDGAGEAQAKL